MEEHHSPKRAASGWQPFAQRVPVKYQRPVCILVTDKWAEKGANRPNWDKNLTIMQLLPNSGPKTPKFAS
jgi:hypothetical protein